jgi:putative transposase
MATISFGGRHFKQELILQSVRWYLAYALSYRDIEEMMLERGINVDHSTIHRWVIHYAPLLEKEFRLKKRKPCGRCAWRIQNSSSDWRLKQTIAV